jgi:hypothetical protein
LAKHRRDNVNIPTGEEYAEVWAAAVIQCHSTFLQPRSPGRPRKNRRSETSPDGVLLGAAPEN